MRTEFNLTQASSVLQNLASVLLLIHHLWWQNWVAKAPQAKESVPALHVLTICTFVGKRPCRFFGTFWCKTLWDVEVVYHKKSSSYHRHNGWSFQLVQVAHTRNLEHKTRRKLWVMDKLLPTVSFWPFPYLCHTLGSECLQSLVVPVSMCMPLAWISKGHPVKQHPSWWRTVPSIFSHVLGLQEREVVMKTMDEELPGKERERVLQQRYRTWRHLQSYSFTTWTLLNDFAHLRKLACICGSEANNRCCKTFMYERQLFQVQTKKWEHCQWATRYIPRAEPVTLDSGWNGGGCGWEEGSSGPAAVGQWEVAQLSTSFGKLDTGP